MNLFQYLFIKLFGIDQQKTHLHVYKKEIGLILLRNASVMKYLFSVTQILLGLLFHLSISAQITIDFDSGTELPHGETYSNEATIGNFRFSYSQDQWLTAMRPGGTGWSLGTLTYNYVPGQSNTIVIESIDQSQFDFQSFWVEVGSFDGSENWTFEGFKDGGSVGTEVITLSGDIVSGHAQTVTPNSTFDDVDKVTITAGNTGYFDFDFFDDFVFGIPLTVDSFMSLDMIAVNVFSMTTQFEQALDSLSTHPSAPTVIDRNGFLSGHTVGNEVFLEYSIQQVVDSINVLNGFE